MRDWPLPGDLDGVADLNAQPLKVLGVHSHDAAPNVFAEGFGNSQLQICLTTSTHI
jgi:hypothetical protein